MVSYSCLHSYYSAKYALQINFIPKFQQIVLTEHILQSLVWIHAKQEFMFLVNKYRSQIFVNIVKKTQTVDIINCSSKLFLKVFSAEYCSIIFEH